MTGVEPLWIVLPYVKCSYLALYTTICHDLNGNDGPLRKKKS